MLVTNFLPLSLVQILWREATILVKTSSYNPSPQTCWIQCSWSWFQDICQKRKWVWGRHSYVSPDNWYVIMSHWRLRHNLLYHLLFLYLQLNLWLNQLKERLILAHIWKGCNFPDGKRQTNRMSSLFEVRRHRDMNPSFQLVQHFYFILWWCQF